MAEVLPKPEEVTPLAKCHYPGFGYLEGAERSVSEDEGQNAPLKYRFNVPIIKLGMIGKLSVVLVSLACVLTGSVSWQMMTLVSADLLYAILFWRALQSIQG